MRILGIDPGLATVGLGLIDRGKGGFLEPLEWLTIETAPSPDTASRLLEIAGDLEQYLKGAKPEIVVIEKLFFATNARTAMAVAEARGVIAVTVGRCGIPIMEPTPLELKCAITGDGNADKRQIQDMLIKILELTVVPMPDDAADALALAVYGAMSLKAQGMVMLGT